MGRTGRVVTGRARRVLAAVMTAVLAVGLAAVAPSGVSVAAPSGDPQADKDWRAKRMAAWPDRSGTPAVRGRVAKPGKASVPVGLPSGKAPAVVWPSAGSATVDVPAVPAAAGPALRAAPAKPGGLPVTLSQPAAGGVKPSRVKVQVLDRRAALAAGVEGVLLKVARQDAGTGPVTLRVDYSGFAGAYGGDWAARLRAVTLPACAATTPARPVCRTGTPIKSINDTADGTVTATLAAASAGSVVALAAAASGGAGDWSATPLAASASWQVSTQTGDFSWSYPLRVPPAVGGPGPDLSLSYSSGSVDGRVASTNNQTSVVGDGWEIGSNGIERKYVSCADDATGSANNVGHKTGDLCWKSDNATLTLGGRASELVKDEGSGAWRLKDDDGTRVQRLTGGWNADNDTEYWKVTTTDGTQYFFGRDKRSASDSADLASAWTVPVYGNHPGEPCHASGFGGSRCTQAWRWNLDYVVDPRGNTMTYFYIRETNNYGYNRNTGVSAYTRGGWLEHIEYGQRAGSENSGSAPARVDFGVSERCLTNCGSLTSDTADNWPDVPYDLICSSDSSCPQVTSPAFFTRKRLTSVTTKVWNGTGYDSVDSWTLAHTFPSPGDGQSNAVLWLNSIEHTGLRGGSLTLPKVTFTGVQLPNRVDRIGDLGPAMIRYRMSWIDTETGGRITVNYDPADCTPSSLPSTPESNTRRCMPVYWTPEGHTDPVREYFHRYRVDKVVADADPTSVGDPEVVTDYTYVGAPAWHYDDNEFTLPKYRTWGEFRGYATAEVATGAPGEQSKTRHRFFRGMHGDHLPGGGSRDVQVDGINDVDRYNGFTREEIVYDGAAGGEVSATVNTPWLSPATATAADGTKAYLLGTGTVETRTTAPAVAGGVRRTRTVTSYDDTYGMVTQVDDQGDTATADDDLCVRHTYARNTSAYIVDTVSRTETVSAACATAPARPGDVVADTRHFYDGKATFGAAPDKGLITKIEEVGSYTGTTPVYTTVTTTGYDSHGRPTQATDALGRTTSTAYTPATGGPVTHTTVTSPDPDGTGTLTAHTSTTDLDPAFGVPTTVTDANGKTTRASYDPLGRLRRVWLPGRASDRIPNLEYDYQVLANAPSTITTKKLLQTDGQLTSIQLFDGLARPRQTQLTALGDEGGRVITDTRYDARGQVTATNHEYYDTAVPGTDLFIPSTVVPGRTEYTYDGAGRTTAEIFLKQGIEQWRTTTAYGGDRVTVDPPTGGTPTTTITDARGRTTALWQHLGAAPTGTHQDTTYSYDHAGRLAGVTDPAGNQWTYGYDLRGRQTTTTDPDRGTTTSTYDNAGQLLTSTDVGRNLTLAYVHDDLGRKTELRDTSATGALRATWTYDTVVKGQLTSATRHDGSAQYTTAVTGYDDGYRPLGHSVTLPATGAPAGEAAIAGTYTTTYTYTIDGKLGTLKHPATANLGAETVTTVYDAAGNPSTMAGGLGWGAYVAGSDWSALGQPLLFDLGNTYFQHLTFDYEQGTNRLTATKLLRQNATGYDLNLTYGYDPAGNVTSITDRPGSGTVDAQCFRYDGLRRLTEAWTPTTANCATNPTTAGLGGPAKYWTSHTFDAVGNRTSEVRHATTTNGTDTTRTYTYPAPGSTRPHALTQIAQTGGAGNRTYRYRYDDAGNTTCRPAGTATNTCPTGTGSQALTWNPEGKLATATNTGGTTQTYVYTADGDRLIRRENGTTTVYLPGGQELRLDVSTGTKTATRYYTFAGTTIAVRTGIGLAGVSTLVADHHATAEISITNTTNVLTRRRHDPYGNPRGTTPTWPGDHGFLDKPKDATGLTHIGAREYDPGIGRFITVDPIMDLTDPQQWHGYAYANNNPTTMTDPTGLTRCDFGDCADSSIRQNGGGATQSRRTTSGGTSRPPTTEEILATPMPLDDVTIDGMWDRGYGGSEKYALGEVLQWADENTSNWVFLCVHKNWGNSESCEINNPLLPDKTRGQKFADVFFLVGVFALGYLLPVVGPVALAEGAAVGIGEFYASGSLLGPAGLGSLAGYGGALTARGGIARGCGLSFSGGTEVLMADGTRRAINDVQVGDQVLATDPETGEQGPRAVTATHVHDDQLLTLVLEDGQFITTTEDHPFWNATERQWQRADALNGDDVIDPDGQKHQVLGLRIGPVVPAPAYNLTVEDLHTYYVLAGKTPVLVHNTGGCPHLNMTGVPDDLQPYIENVVRQMDIDGALPPGVQQGGGRTGPGIYSGSGLPPASPRYYVETDILPTPPGSTRPASGRLIFGGRGEVWYTGHYDDGFIQIRGPNCGC